MQPRRHAWNPRRCTALHPILGVDPRPPTDTRWSDQWAAVPLGPAQPRSPYATHPLGDLCRRRALALTTVSASPAVARHGHHNLPHTIDLPNGWQPEGITTDGKSVFSGSLADGAIFRANVRSGHGKVLAPGATGRVAAGLDYDRRRDLLLVVGGPTGEIRAQDADNGKVLATYEFPSATPRFLNDVVVTRRAVFATDSSNQELR